MYNPTVKLPHNNLSYLYLMFITKIFMLSTVANTKMFFHITGAQPFLLFQGCQLRARKAALRFECHAMINRTAASILLSSMVVLVHSHDNTFTCTKQ